MEIKLGVSIILILIGIPLIAATIVWLIIDPSTAIERAASVCVCLLVSIVVFFGVIIVGS